VSDINTAVVDSLKVLDPKRPIREATLRVHRSSSVNAVPVGPMQRRMSAIGGKAHIAALSWSGHLVIDLDQKRQCKAELRAAVGRTHNQ